jgi:hypothetical protein
VLENIKGRYLACDPDQKSQLQSRPESVLLSYVSVLSRVRLGIVSITKKDKSFVKARVKTDR